MTDHAKDFVKELVQYPIALESIVITKEFISYNAVAKLSERNLTAYLLYILPESSKTRHFSLTHRWRSGVGFLKNICGLNVSFSLN